MATQFTRIYELQVGIPANEVVVTENVPPLAEGTTTKPAPGAGKGISITELQVEFDVKLSSDSTANTCTIKVTNLNEENRAKLNKDKAVILKVGYRDQGLVTLFTGTIFSFSSEQKGTDIVTTIQVGDGFTPLNEKSICDVRSGSVEDLFRFLAKKLGVPIGTLSNGSLKAGEGLSRVYDKENPYVLSGKVKSVMDKLAKANKLEWYIEAGYLIVTPVGGLRLEAEVQVENGSGLIGSPSGMSQGLSDKGSEKGDKNKDGIKFETLINPAFVIGRKVRVHSKFYKGVPARVTKVTHKGSLRGKSWFSLVESEIISDE